MIAMILAAGLGLRMRPLTLLRAKPVLPVMNRPLLLWTLERLAAHGIRDVIVNLHHRPESVTEALGDGRALGVRVRYSQERRILGTGGGPRAVRDALGRDPFLLVNGDMLFEFDLRALLERHRRSGARATLALRRNPDPREYGAVVTDRRGRIQSIAGRPRRARGTVSMFTGVHVLDPALLDRLPAGPSSIVNELYAPLIEEGALIEGVRVSGAWYDLGRPRLYRDVQLRALAGKRDPRGLVDPAAQVSRRARVKDAVVGAGAEVGEGARVRRSVLWERARVEKDARVEGCVVVDGGVVRTSESARGVIVLPERAVRGRQDVGGRVERRGGMAWVRIR
jgi:NDP-sugar pyrophosphorylase family protein